MIYTIFKYWILNCHRWEKRQLNICNILFVDDLRGEMGHHSPFNPRCTPLSHFEMFVCAIKKISALWSEWNNGLHFISSDFIFKLVNIFLSWKDIARDVVLNSPGKCLTMIRFSCLFGYWVKHGNISRKRCTKDQLLEGKDPIPHRNNTY